MRDELTRIGLPDTFFNQRGVIVVEREVLIHGFIENEAAVTLLESSQGVESGLLVDAIRFLDG